MKELVKVLITTMTHEIVKDTSIIDWACPVISFGNINSKLATVGINPSNLEFTDRSGNELGNDHRRFPTLRSLKLVDWDQLTDKDLNAILESCNEYFQHNPYDTWFKQLDYLISGAIFSYYFPLNNSCHLDIIPYATSKKWSDIDKNEKSKLLQVSSDSLGIILAKSKIEYLILNGSAVVEHVQNLSSSTFKKEVMTDWSLRRKSKEDVKGFCYYGHIDKIGAIDINRKIKVLGYNHNIQSSYGVTNQVRNSIRSWIKKKIKHDT